MNNNVNERELCIRANKAYEEGYEGYFDDIMTDILNDEIIQNMPYALTNKGYFCFKVGDEDKGQNDVYAVSLLKKALDILPSNYKALWLLGKFYYEKEMYSDSAEQYMKAVEIKKDVISLNNAGAAFHKLKKHRESEKYFKQAMDKKDSPNAKYNFILECIINKKISVAETILSQLDPTNDIDCIDIGRLYFLLEKYNKVCELYGSEWNNSFPNALDLSVYLYSLKKTDDIEKYNLIQNNSLEYISNFVCGIDDPEVNDFYLSKAENIRVSINKINSGHKPEVYPEPIMIDPCYLYYCVVHDKDEIT